MNTKPKSEISEVKRNILLVCLAAIIGIIVYFIEPFAAKTFHWNSMLPHESLPDASEMNPPGASDSIQLYNSKVPYTDFMSNYSAEILYLGFKDNPVLFNDTYNNRHIDVAGIIKSISISLSGYSVIRLTTGENATGDIVCDNIKHDKDAWKEEVKSVIVGDTVHIQGVYGKMGLDQDNLYLEHCHIIR